MDLHESESSNQITATFELPGLKKEDVSIDIHNGRLTVSGETNISNEKASENGYSIRERRYGKFQRSLPLPKGVKVGSERYFCTDELVLICCSSQAEDVKATMENGVLNVTFPRAGPEQQPQRITIS
jgi:HSP20 family protein